MTAHDANKTFRVRLRVKSFPPEKAGYTHAMPSAIPATLNPEWKEWLNRPYPAKERRPARVRLRVTHCKDPDIRMVYSDDAGGTVRAALSPQWRSLADGAYLTGKAGSALRDQIDQTLNDALMASRAATT